jgi:hypothetical protein
MAGHYIYFKNKNKIPVQVVQFTVVPAAHLASDWDCEKKIIATRQCNNNAVFGCPDGRLNSRHDLDALYKHV